MVLTSIPPAVITAFLTTLTTILDPTIVGENALDEVSPGVGKFYLKKDYVIIKNFLIIR